MPKTSYTFELNPEQIDRLCAELDKDKYQPAEVPHTLAAARLSNCGINLYKSGKCLVQGKGAEEWVTFVLEPEILGAVVTGYDEVLNAGADQPHMGIDESGKGDFFGPLVIASAYIDPAIAKQFRELDVKDSKRITSDRKMLKVAAEVRKILGNRFVLVTIGPKAYNRLYAKFSNVNRLLAWGHARAIEDLLARVPDCPRAVADQFGPKHRIERALMKAGREIELEQRHKAESDLAVAAASILARAAFLDGLEKIGKKFDRVIPKGASAQVRSAAEELVGAAGPAVLNDVAKCHFKTADQVLEAKGFSRSDLPDPEA